MSLLKRCRGAVGQDDIGDPLDAPVGDRKVHPLLICWLEVKLMPAPGNIPMDPFEK
jgi:hypothetical protein